MEVAFPTALDLSDLATFAGLILAGLAGMWALRKAIKTTNRS